MLCTIGYGFIENDDGSADAFFQFTVVDGPQTLNEDQRVESGIGDGPNGPVATEVTFVQAWTVWRNPAI
ncbi:hypothetical protein BOTBODRAFT_29477 [Botryobasidium botryosum FD-172 SS1]|uniref:CSD domain-containing protein n=1 Tax=Botryobasidium botryosum (strain FD-172 SS1) TaxID=930990 RepID=A0A067N1V8_BOTB1|nr:hypothetical protein BOTBODRAFT_29477 [Botryobasidium botryosum FD-172 SS1]